ncbi:hypothetical protein [Lacticaseibacillus paracasei]|uniref:hypothetical protein n=1 Tax=Lacticaseibacillus paracasei TaxID=1597 RepID=UPI002731B66C|nr:hypothetical protein [Lacticaseibacillus paracasei]MDP0529290.1 hypothetical protein [Lacticaseibacillus paracasei]
MSKPVVKDSHVMYKVHSQIRAIVHSQIRDSSNLGMNFIKIGMNGKLSVSIGKISVFDAIKQGEQ